MTQWQDFSLSQVKVLDSYSADLAQKVVDFINSYNPDRLLYNFRVTAGLVQPLNIFKPYPGWEDARIGGHTLGHYLTALAQAAAHGYGNCSGADGRTISQRLVYIVDVLEECQNAYPEKNGFIFGAKLESGQAPEWQFDKMETKDPADTWVPWYTMHKILNGLVAAYELTENEKALSVAQKLGLWCSERTSRWSEDVKAAILAVEYGGMNDCLYELYKCSVNTKNPFAQAEKFAAAAHQFDEVSLFDLVLSGKKDVLDNKHANCTIPKFIGALNRYEALGDEKYLEYAKAFWNLVVNHHTYITGGNSECEYFGKDDILDAERSNTNCETCNTHNMLKLTRELFKITGEKKYADYYEQTYINAILASANNRTGMTTYFQPMATGCFKVYCNENLEQNFFWCCTGTGLENFTKLGDSFYFYDDSSSVPKLAVNVYFSSKLTWSQLGITLVQTADFPENDKVTFEFTEASDKEVELLFRIPSWTSKVSAEEGDAGTDFIRIKRVFKAGDKITLQFKQSLNAYSLPDGTSLAFKYGPVVLGAELGADNKMDIHQIGILCDVCGNRKVKDQLQPLPGQYFHTTGIGTLPGEHLIVKNADSKAMSQNPEKYFKKSLTAEGKVCFELKAENWNENLRFVPYYKIHEQRYGLYWKF